MKKLIKPLLVGLGLVFVIIGMIGVFVPGLPTTIFMILAAYCFVRSSERLYNWVVSNKLFGYRVKHFIETKTIPLKGKVHSITAMWIAVALSIYFINGPILVEILIVIAAIIGTIVILSYPTAKDI